jgi:hypothetical protein
MSNFQAGMLLIAGAVFIFSGMAFAIWLDLYKRNKEDQ